MDLSSGQIRLAGQVEVERCTERTVATMAYSQEDHGEHTRTVIVVDIGGGRVLVADVTKDGVRVSGEYADTGMLTSLQQVSKKRTKVKDARSLEMLFSCWKIAGERPFRIPAGQFSTHLQLPGGPGGAMKHGRSSFELRGTQSSDVFTLLLYKFRGSVSQASGTFGQVGWDKLVLFGVGDSARIPCLQNGVNRALEDMPSRTPSSVEALTKGGTGGTLLDAVPVGVEVFGEVPAVASNSMLADVVRQCPWGTSGTSGTSSSRGRHIERPLTRRLSGSRFSVEQLPDYDVLEVLSYLGTEDLLQCRAVCRRWRSLVQHPSLWREHGICCCKSVTCGLEHFPAVLRFAPCLRILRIGMSDSKISRWDDILSSACAVYDLAILFHSSDAGRVALLLSRQVSLGRLKGIYISVASPKEETDDRELVALFLQLTRTHGLDSIEVKAAPDVVLPTPTLPSPAGDEVPVPASLNHISSEGEAFDPYLLKLLEWHAATLESLNIESDDRRVAPLLSSMPRLAVLKCPLLEDMSVFQGSTLHNLTLDIGLAWSKLARLPEVARFLSMAVSHICHLKLAYEDDDPPAEAVDLVLSLGGTDAMPSKLRYLELSQADTYSSVLQQPLASILHRLPLLTILDLDAEPSDAFLEAMDGKVLPELRELRVYADDVCEHEWAHSEKARKLFGRYRQLRHLVIKWATERGDCAFCQEHTCHSVPEKWQCIVFTHPMGASCCRSHKYFIEIQISAE